MGLLLLTPPLFPLDGQHALSAASHPIGFGSPLSSMALHSSCWPYQSFKPNLIISSLLGGTWPQGKSTQKIIQIHLGVVQIIVVSHSAKVRFYAHISVTVNAAVRGSVSQFCWKHKWNNFKSEDQCSMSILNFASLFLFVGQYISTIAESPKNMALPGGTK